MTRNADLVVMPVSQDSVISHLNGLGGPVNHQQADLESGRSPSWTSFGVEHIFRNEIAPTFKIAISPALISMRRVS